MFEVCERMRDPHAVDRCIEYVIRNDKDPVDDDVCERISDRSLRDACWLAAARRHVTGSLDEAIAACDRVERLVPTCTAELIDHRATLWRDDISRFTAEVAGLVDYYPRLAYDSDFATAVGRASRAVGVLPGLSGPCDAFPPGNGSLTCQYALSY